MVKLTKIYTKSGDQGFTSLGNQKRVQKNDPRIQAIGAIDETNAIIGVCYAHAPHHLKEILKTIQNDLFDCGADICIPQEPLQKKALRILDAHITNLETKIDFYNKELSPLKSFVLPGGTVFSSFLHLARTITRRAEREVLTLLQQETPVVHAQVMVYLNRLSDLLFVLARFANQEEGGDILWVPGDTLETKN